MVYSSAMETSRPHRIIAVAGPLSGTVHPLDARGLTVGRALDADLSVKDSAVSREHCRIEPEDRRFRLTDLGSRHGTFVNGARVTSCLLNHNDHIAVGRSAFVFLVADSELVDERPTVELSDDVTVAGTTREIQVANALFLRPERVFPALANSARMAADLDILSRAGAVSSSVAEIEPLAERLLELVLQAVPADRAGILLSPAGASPSAETTFPVTYTRRRSQSDTQTVTVSRTIARHVVRDRVAILASGVLPHAPWTNAPSVVEAGIRSVICVPLFLYDRVIGVFYLDASDPKARFDQGHLELVTAIAAMAALPLEDALRRRAVAPGAPAIEAVAGVTGTATVIFRPTEALDLGAALAMHQALAMLPAGQYPRVLLALDYGVAPGARGIAENWADRIAALCDDCVPTAGRATSIPSIAFLASTVAATLPARAGDAAFGASEWFQRILLATGLVVARAAYAAVETAAVPSATARHGAAVKQSDGERPADPAENLALARELATRINKLAPGSCPRPSPALGGQTSFLALDGSGAMGASPRGTVYIADTADAVARKLRSAKTDTRPHLDPEAEISPEVRNLLLLHHALTGEPSTAALARFAGKGYGVLKGELAEAANAFLEPLRKRRLDLLEDGLLEAMLASGSAELNSSGEDMAKIFARTPGTTP